MKRVAAWITANVPGHHATIEPAHTNTDRFTRGGGARCIRWPGKGRSGYLLRVYGRDPFRAVYQHDSSATYRHNGEISDWVDQQTHKKGK